MTLEIEDTTVFRDKLAHLIDGINALNKSGVDPEAKFDQELLDSFLNQFKVEEDDEEEDGEEPKTLRDYLPDFSCDRGGIKYGATTFRAGYVIININSGYVPPHFHDKLYVNTHDASWELTKWLAEQGLPREKFDIREVTYKNG